MANLTIAAFLSKWAGVFADNSERLISEEDMRDFRQDIADSFFNSNDNAYTTAFPIITIAGTSSYTGTANPSIGSYTNNQKFILKATSASAGDATLNLNTIGAKKLFKSPTVQATTGDIPAGGYLFVVYDTSLDSGTGGFIVISGISSGGVQSIVAGTNITVDDTDPQNPIVSAASSGTVTLVSAGNLSPLFTASVATATTTPAITFAQVTQGANLVFAGPGAGADANPTFRSLVAADMPDLSSVYQPLDGDLTAIAALGFVAESFLKKTAANTWTLDANTYLPEIGGTLTGFLFLHADPTQLLHAATKQYVDNTVNSAVTGLWDDRGAFDASVNAYPSSGGSGTAGAIMKGDIWTISVAGTLPTGQVVEPGDTVRSLIDTPGNTQANWAIAQNNIGYTPLTSTLNSAHLFVGSAGNVATAVSLSGAISITNTGLTDYAGTVPVNKGGTNITSYAVGDLIYASGATALSKLAAVATGSVLGSAGTTTAPAYLAVSNGLTATATTFKLGGALTADTSISGTFSLSFAGGASGAGATVYTFTPTLTATANSQTQYGADINLIPVDGAFTGLTRSFMRMRSNSSATNTYDFGTSTFTTTGLTSADFNGGSMRLRNTTGPFNIQGGTGSGDCLRFSGVFTNSVDNHIAFRFTNGGSANSTALHTAGTAVTRTWNAIVSDWTVSSVNGSTITYLIDKVIPTISVGNSTLTLTWLDYNPDLSGSSGTITHYAIRARAGLSAFGQSNAPTASIDIAASTTAAASIRVRSGTAPTSPNDGDLWYDGTDVKFRVGGTTKTFTLT